MAQFKLVCEKVVDVENGEPLDSKEFIFDTLENKLWTSETEYIGLKSPDKHTKVVGILSSNIIESLPSKFEAPWGPSSPATKSKKPKRIKIQLGLTCNFECSYCSQRFVARPVQGNPGKVDGLVKQISEVFELARGGEGVQFEFWGGEPFVYWKTLKPLAEKLGKLYPYATLQIITNGSMLTKEIVDWLYALRFNVAISHDGPGQSVRGPCPIDDGSEETKEALKYILEKLGPLGKVGFNSMLNAQNMSRANIRKWFEDRFGENFPPIGEGGLIDAYDEDGKALSLNSLEDHFLFRNTALKDILQSRDLKFQIVSTKIKGIITSLVENRVVNTSSSGQKCGMDREDYISFDMDGNILTCQNTSSVQEAPNGKPHLIGNLENLENTKLTSATHWADRPHCYNCPVLNICKGSCMFLQGDNWATSCDNAYSDNIVFLATAIFQLTGYLPVYIDNDYLPAHRRDIWGKILEHKETRKKPFPVKVISK